MSLPAWMQPHVVTVATRTGATGAGDVFAADVDVNCWRDATVRMVRNAQGVEVVSSTTVRTSDDRALWAPGSTVTWVGGSGTVISATQIDGGDAYPWPHTEVSLT